MNVFQIANIGNPQAKAIAGFQNPFMAEWETIELIVQDAAAADTFEIIFSNDDLEVYEYRRRIASGRVKLIDIKYIASLIMYEGWIVIQGLIAFTMDSGLNCQIISAKRSLIQSIYDLWGFDLMSKEERK